jgi:hypothetical protein
MKQALIFVHRWLGVVLCLFFLLWFPSGFVMMYWDYPSVRPADRLAHTSPLDPATIHFSPLEAAAKADIKPAGSIRLTTFDGRPVYRFGGPESAVVYADTGEEQVEITQESVAHIATAWSGQPVKAATVYNVEQSDQWTLQNRVRDLQPLWKFSWPDGQQLYVSQANGDVIQYTTTASRMGAYFGAIPHWLYFTPLRRNGPMWNRVVIWSSGIATFASILGIVIGVWMLSPSKRYRHNDAQTSIPYHGWKRWHTIIGLIAGIGAVTWAFSGLLSMEPFPRRDNSPGGRGGGGRRGAQSVLQALRGRAQLEKFAAKDPRAALAQLANLRVKELELTSFAGEPAYLATMGAGDTRIVPVDGEPRTELDTRRIINVVERVSQPLGGAKVSVLSEYDRYYLDRHHEAPLPVVLVELNDIARTRYYIDPKSARTVGGYTSSGFIDRWLYHGLHSLNFPWLYNHRPAWDIIVIGFMIGGTALSVTSLVMAWQVLGRKLRLIHG